MKKIILLIAIVATSMASAQKYFTKTGLTEFKASVEAFEPVEAKNESTTAILNTETGDIAALLFVKAFHFEIALMEEHFNENYMDSDKFPKATFKGKIEDFSIESLTPTEKEFTLKGMLTVRGKTKSIESIVQIKNTDGKIVLSSEFSVSPKDFDIEIPSIVRKKIAESIYIKFCYELIEKK
ncbi:YceI family protein [uncultured Winogradskyella sp.]|uniref:YceI family protein n=1 Tax=uncultured Winogradskyella sp. TaxID=395353 RepID=UPI0030D769C1|tara:strand:+ start:11792 stop:12337 length:546 start_codon:yes stop_codon:yes gene_type:complete